MRPLHPPPADKNNKYASRLGYLRDPSSLFALVKAWSVVWLERMFSHMQHVPHTNIEVANMSRAYNDVLRLNIMEAYIADKFYLKMSDNALTASALLHEADMPLSIHTRSDGMKDIEVGMNQFYDALYFNWNLTFISVGCNPWLLLAKLLQPEVACAHPNRFIIVRAISLKIVVQTTRWAEFLGRPYIAPLNLVFTREVREAMAKINKRAAKTYVEQCSDNKWNDIETKFSLQNFLSVNKSLYELTKKIPYLWAD